MTLNGRNADASPAPGTRPPTPIGCGKADGTTSRDDAPASKRKSNGAQTIDGEPVSGLPHTPTVPENALEPGAKRTPTGAGNTNATTTSATKSNGVGSPANRTRAAGTTPHSVNGNANIRRRTVSRVTPSRGSAVRTPRCETKTTTNRTSGVDVNGDAGNSACRRGARIAPPSPNGRTTHPRPARSSPGGAGQETSGCSGTNRPRSRRQPPLPPMHSGGRPSRPECEPTRTSRPGLPPS